jgi:WD40 repeat protein/energy-coupling factor transporter ATP-binding protein EcfA2
MKSPFKFLDSYSKDDREIFFGREKETEELSRRLFESKVLLIYGESGTGKSSLVNCGLINKLNENEYLPIYIRRGDNILESLSEAIQLLLEDSSPRQLLTALLFKKALREISDDKRKHLFFIFDQFEELFIFGTKEERQSLIQVLKVLLESDIDCRFTFIIREEYFSNVAEFEKYIPNFLSNRMRIEKMDRTNAIATIKGSCSVYDIQVEDGFAESLLKRINPDSTGIELTYLQIFLDRIFNLAAYDVQDDKKDQRPLLFTTGLIEKAGDVSDLLGRFLDDQISLSAKPDTALAILKSFVSYKGTKRLLNLAEVKDYTNTLGEYVREKSVLDIIGSLVQLRILCDKNENGFYELRHDALAARIFEKISAAELEILEVRQFIESAHYFWKKHGVLLSEDDLKYIAPFEKKLSLSEELNNFVGKSRETFNLKRNRRRNIIVSGGIAIILLLSVFSIWALKERNISESLKIKALAEKYNLLATNIAIHDPTKGIRLAEYAYSLDSENLSIRNNIKRIYSDNIFYTLIAKQEDAIAKQEDAISSVAFSPDSRYILTGSGDASARIWDLNGNMIRIFIGHSGYVNSVAFSPDGRTILTGSSDRSARLWDINGKVIMDFKGHSMAVNSVAFSPDGKQILTGSLDRTARLWDLEGNVIQEFKGHKSSVTAVAFSPDGQNILTGSSDSTGILWNLRGKQLKVLSRHQDNVNTVAFSPDGQMILTGSSDKTVKLSDLNGKLLRIFNGFPGEVNDVVFSPDGKKILVGASAGYAVLWDLNGNEIKEFKGHTIQVKAVAFSPDGTKIVTGSGDCTAKLWDLNENLNQVFSGHTGKITSLQFSKDGKRFLSGSLDKTICLQDITGNTFRVFGEHRYGINDAVFSPDGQTILTGSNDNTAKLWDIHGNLIKVFSGHKSMVTSVAFSPDGLKILTGSQDATARIWDINGNTLTILKGHNSNVNSVAFSPDGKTVLTGSRDYSARLWDLDGNLITALKGQSSAINSVAFSPDGLTFLTGSFGSDPSARLWDLKGNLLRVFKGHTTSIFSAAFSPDGKKILTGSADQTAILWDINGNIDQVFSGYKSYVTSVAFSPDGKSILIGMDNGSIRLYPVKMSYKSYNKTDKYEKLSSFDKLEYNITDINKIRRSDNEKTLLQASQYYVNEATQSGMRDKSKYLSYAVELYNKLLEANPDKKEYLFNFLRASIYSYEANPNDRTKDEIEKINDKILSFESVDDLTLAGYAYCIICAKNDQTLDKLGIPECFLKICEKLLACRDLPGPEKKDISRWCSYIASDFVTKKEFPLALRSIKVAEFSDSTNIEIHFLLPIIYILNNQYDIAKTIINEYKNKPLNGVDYFTTYTEVFNHSIDLLEDRAITHPDFAKAKMLLNE